MDKLDIFFESMDEAISGLFEDDFIVILDKETQDDIALIVDCLDRIKSKFIQ